MSRSLSASLFIALGCATIAGAVVWLTRGASRPPEGEPAGPRGDSVLTDSPDRLSTRAPRALAWIEERRSPGDLGSAGALGTAPAELEGGPTRDSSDEHLFAVVRGALRSADLAEPLASVRIEIASRILAIERSARTDGDGRFDLGELPIAAGYRLRADAGERYVPLDRPFEVTPRLGPLDLTVDSIHRVRVVGEVVGTGGKALQGLKFQAASRRSPKSTASGITDAQGRFALELAVGPTSLNLEDASSAARIRVLGLVLERDTHRELRLVTDAGSAEIQGRLVDRSGTALEGAGVELSWRRSEDGVTVASTRKTVTGDDGTFRFSAVGSGEHHLVLRAAGFATVSRSVAVEGDVDLGTLEARAKKSEAPSDRRP